LAQIAAVGSTAAAVFLHLEDHSALSLAIAFGFTLIAAGFFSAVDRRITQITHEAVIGVAYAIAAAGALFIMALHSGGDVHMENMLTGSILWAQWPDIAFCAGVFAIVGLLHWKYRQKFITLSENYHDKQMKGRPSAWWDFLFYTTMGLVITISVKIAGVLVIFAFLIIPATISAMLSNSWKNRLLYGWAFGILATLLGLWFSFKFDFTCGTSIVAFLGLALIIVSLLKKRSKTEKI
jgi:zinc/manganese transport system permease protein